MIVKAFQYRSFLKTGKGERQTLNRWNLELWHFVYAKQNQC